MKKLIFALICLFLVVPSQAATYYVNPWDSIQPVIDNPIVVDGDKIIVLDGTYTGEGNRDIDFNGKAITLQSENGPENCIIDCNGSPDEFHRGFYFHSGEDGNSVLDGFMIINGYVDGAWPGGNGGGIYCDESSPTISNCIINENSAYGDGGGMYNSWHSNPTLINCTFSDNSTDWNGGGILNFGSPTLIDCIFSRNSARCKGGGMDTSPGTWGMFSGNSSGWSGKVFDYDSSNTTLVNCIFSGNSAGGAGGGMYNSDSAPILINCVFNGNLSQWYGGGMCSGGLIGEPTLINCILWGNSDSGGAGELAQFYGRIPIINYSCVQGWTGSFGGIGNIGADPCFVEPGYWADANDPNIVVEPNDPNAVWIEGDYYLLPDSPCIDSGDNNSVPADIHDLDGDGNTAEPLPFDLDGNPRFVDRPDIEDTGNGTPPIVDMGAYEAMVSCFGVNHVKLGTKAGKKGNKVEVKGTFDPALPIDFAVDDVTYTIDDGLDYMLTFIIPAGSFEPEGKPEKQKFKFDSPKHSQPGIKAKFDFLKCKFELKVKEVMDTSEITAETLAIVLQAGANIAQEIVELEVKGKKGEHLEYKRKPKFECCPEM